MPTIVPYVVSACRMQNAVTAVPRVGAGIEVRTGTTTPWIVAARSSVPHRRSIHVLGRTSNGPLPCTSVRSCGMHCAMRTRSQVVLRSAAETVHGMGFRCGTQPLTFLRHQQSQPFVGVDQVVVGRQRQRGVLGSQTHNLQGLSGAVGLRGRVLHGLSANA